MILVENWPLSHCRRVRQDISTIADDFGMLIFQQVEIVFISGPRKTDIDFVPNSEKMHSDVLRKTSFNLCLTK